MSSATFPNFMKQLLAAVMMRVDELAVGATTNPKDSIDFEAAAKFEALVREGIDEWDNEDAFARRLRQAMETVVWSEKPDTYTREVSFNNLVQEFCPWVLTPKPQKSIKQRFVKLLLGQ